MNERSLVWSYGGGTQSVAIAVLVSQGKLPLPERIFMADTSRETRVAFSYTDEYVRDLVHPIPIEIIDHSYARVDAYDSKGRLLIPAWTTKNGGIGRLPTYCSAEWKRDVCARWLREKGYGPKKPVTMWLGISVDELHRAKPARQAWIEHRFPLLFDVPLTRRDCVSLVEGAGLPTPPRSACWMCPHRSDAQWRELRDERPDEWALAVDFDGAIREQSEHWYLHRSALPLVEAPIDTAPSGGGLWDQDGCETGYCFV
jgi:hypothetical protein